MPVGGATRAVGLDGDVEATRLGALATAASSSCRRGSPPVQTTMRFRSVIVARPLRGDGVREGSAVANLPPPSPSVPTKSVSQNLQIARSRSSSRPVHRLQEAEAAEHRRAAGVRALALQRVEDLLDLVGHGVASTGTDSGSSSPASAKPLRRSRHESQ